MYIGVRDLFSLGAGHTHFWHLLPESVPALKTSWAEGGLVHFFAGQQFSVSTSKFQYRHRGTWGYMYMQAPKILKCLPEFLHWQLFLIFCFFGGEHSAPPPPPAPHPVHLWECMTKFDIYADPCLLVRHIIGDKHFTNYNKIYYFQYNNT